MEKPSGDISSSSQKFRESDDSSPSSTRAITAASLYNLNEDDSTPILLYRQGKGSLRKVTQRELCELLDDEPEYREYGVRRYRLTRKEIPRFASVMEFYRHDMWFDDEKEAFKQLKAANYNDSAATVMIPRHVWKRHLFGFYKELYMLSPACGRPSIDLSSASSRYMDSKSSNFASEVRVINPWYREHSQDENDVE